MLLQMPDTPPTPRSRLRGVALSLLLLAVGVAILAWTVRQLDVAWQDVRADFSRVGYWFVAILLLSLLRFVVRSRAWVVLTGLPIPLRAAVAASISGDALGNVTPLGLMASEPAKALYLRRHAAPELTLPALVAENFFYSVSVALYVILSAGTMFLFFDLPDDVKLAGQVSLGGMAAVLGVAAWLAWQKPTVASALIARLPIPKAAALADRARRFEQHTYVAVGRGGHPLLQVALCEVSFHLLSLIECWLTFWLLSGVSAPLPALIFDGFNRVVNVLFKHLPLRVGVEEGGTSLLAAAIGLSAHAGFMLGVVRKVRVLVWAAVGLILWASAGRRRA